MGEKIIVGPVNKGLSTDRTPFIIDNDSFPMLINAYQWRGRIKRKRGTSLLNRLERYFNSGATTITFDGSGNANLIAGYSLEANGNIVPGTVIITGSIGPVTYTDPTMDGYLTPTGTSGPNTINYATGAIHIPAQAGGTATVSFFYYPDLPVMGLEDIILDAAQYAGTIAFDTKYSYNILTTVPYNIYDVSYYKNPIANPTTLPGYIQKTTVTPLTWNGQNYQQFWTANYQGAFWATNGINVPFTNENIGMQYKPIISVTVISGGPPAIVNLLINAHGLVVGDFLFINEVLTTTGINLQTGYVIAVVDANNVRVEFPNATIAGNGTVGIAQYLTNRSDPTKDCIRWYDGDPTEGDTNPPVITGNLGWVNFMPPLIFNTANNLSIDDLPVAIYYLVGARMIVPYKDRLLFFGPVIQTSTPNSQVYLQDAVIYSQNGTPFYTASFTGNPTLATTIFNPILTPINQSAAPTSYFSDLTGFGGWIAEGSSRPITTVAPNEDVLMVGFTNKETRFVYTGDDIIPFNFFTVNSEFGSGSTFSSITLDRGALKIGDRGIILSSQVASQRIDIDIPDQVFEISLISNGAQRITAQRDFISEWAYFTYASNENIYIYPTQTLQYNYREETWGIFNEAYTTYGQFRKTTGYTWATIGMLYPTWSVWNDPWNAGASTLLQPQVIAGNQQGFVFFREEGTTEEESLYIQSFSGSQVTSPDHCLNNGDYIVINGALGTIGALVNGLIFQIYSPAVNTFMLSPAIGTGTYLGGGTITRMYVPQIQTKQFPVSWGMGRKTRLGPQLYLLTRTDNGQVELQIFLSQDAANAYNAGPVIPSPNVVNNTLVYTDTLYTCPESANLGLTPANSNLQMLVDPSTGVSTSAQIWHRMNTSLLGDTVQIGFTLSDMQMRDVNFNNQFAEIELHSIILEVSPSSMLA
jgi:hypothetical protein